MRALASPVWGGAGRRAKVVEKHARLDMKRCASGGIILSSVAIRYQLGLVFQAGSLIVPLSASTPHGT